MNHFFRRAEFIWRPRDLTRVTFSTAAPRVPAETNRFVYFRRVIEIADAIQSAPVMVTADGRYQLFVNGVLVGRGPARSSAAYRYADPYDLAPYLKPGRNVIAALAHSYGRNTAWYELPGWDYARAFGCGGFFLQGEVVTARDVVQLDTDASWRCLTADVWQRDVPSNSLGFSEVYDARRAPENWNALAFDDTSWEHAEILRVPGRNYTGDVIPFQFLAVRDIPAQREGPLAFGAVLSCNEIANAPTSNDLAAQMDQEIFLPLTHCRVINVIASEAKHSPTTEITTTDAHSVSIVYDFGQVVAGYIRFELEGAAGALVDFYPGEQLLPDGRVRIFDGIPGFDAPIAHRYILCDGAQTWERFEWNGLRYLQVTYRNCAQPLHVRAVAVNQTGYPVQARGQFECSDDTLNRIWHAGARTLQLCMHDAFVDCPSREQRQWMDAYLDTRINYAAFGDAQLAARMMRQIALSQRPEGLTMMAAPGDFSVLGFTNIPDFCLYWIMTIGDYIQFTGETKIVDELYSSVVKAIQWFERQLNAENLLTDVPHWVFVEWAETDKKGQVAALNAQFVAALCVAAQIARIAEHSRAAIYFDALATRVRDALNELLWDESRGVYADARRDGKLSRRISQQSNAAMIAFDIAPRERWDRMFETILDESRLVLTHALGHDGEVTPFDEEKNVVQAQPFYSHFLHRALRQAGKFDNIIANIRARWSAMIANGESTFRETWQLEPITSKCHAWSATPTFDLSTDILGIAPLEPGFARFRVAPQIENLAWARGAFPTPRGDIQVAWRRDANRFELSLTVPENTQAEIVLPAREIMIVGAGTHRVVVE
ncbi:MAG: family 78 glycoside hydrolase catalytic domain [Chloroflexi bacterium]|nr:family 78 glycoside hydrolase catalytic domain [Chloroflexota bacterium]